MVGMAVVSLDLECILGFEVRILREMNDKNFAIFTYIFASSATILYLP